MKIRLRALLLCVLLIAAGLMLAWAARPAPELPAAEETPEKAAALAAAPRESGYCLRAVNGRVAVFRDDSEIQLLAETGIDIALLRAVDREKLEKGICVKTYEEVLQLLEDFNS
jgi:tetrahydromethanopterin S-methyltransferase subunit H